MYSDINNLIHDLELMGRVHNLVASLRYQYKGISPESVQAISTQIGNEIRRKDAQITLIDRSCFQLRIRSKNHKELVCVQMSDPEAKKDWLTDVRLAKLALDRGNNPAWDVIAEANLSASSGNIHGMTQQRVPLFVKSLPIFATSETSQLTCALFYQLTSPVPGGEMVSNVLWICNVNESGSQLGALSTNGSDVSLIHSYELCDSQVTCLESVGNFSVWIGLKEKRVIVIDAASPEEWRQLATLEVSGEVTCIKHFGHHVYVGLKTGKVVLFDITQTEEPMIVNLSQSPVSCMIPIGTEIFATSHDKIWVLKGPSIERSYFISKTEEPEQKPHLLAHCGIGLWVSIEGTSIIRLFHTETFMPLQDLNIGNLSIQFVVKVFILIVNFSTAPNVKRVLGEATDYPITITSMLATRGMLWVGTNVGVVSLIFTTNECIYSDHFSFF
jgi:Rho guanine nucleotide exchange factor 10